MELFKAIVDESKQHPNFKSISDAQLFQGEHAVIRKWAEGFIDRDNKFVYEFQSTFNSSFWELYLHAAFRELGFLHDYSHAAPDYVLRQEGCVEIVAEAVIASHAEGFRPEWERPLQSDALKGFDKEQVVALATIRLSNAICAKHTKYIESYQHLAHVEGKPFVVCVAPFEQPFFFSQNDNAVRRVLYGFDGPIYKEDEQTGERTVLGESRIKTALKHNGSPVNQGLFTKPGFDHISAVIFSNTATWTKVRAMAPAGDYPLYLAMARYNDHGPNHILEEGLRPNVSESLLDGLHVMINPFAKNPLPKSLFDRPEIAIHTFDPQTEDYEVDVKHRFLIQHGSMSFLPRGEQTKRFSEIRAETEKLYQEFDLPPYPPGQLMLCGSVAGPFEESHMAHHRGWTIIVARCSIDGDWGAQAIPCVVHTVRQYADRDQDLELLLPDNWHDTPEDAYRAMQKKIDRRLQPGYEQKSRRKNRQQRQKLLEQAKRKSPKRRP